MTNRLLECVPNFSEGRNTEIIQKITNEVKHINGIKLLNKTNNNVIYKNEKNEMYSNFWWNIYF